MLAGTAEEGVWAGAGSGTSSIGNQCLLDLEGSLCLCGWQTRHNRYSCSATALHVAYDQGEHRYALAHSQSTCPECLLKTLSCVGPHVQLYVVSCFTL